MHAYYFHIGDYARRTKGLSDLEDLAYRRMMDEYYLNEQPFNTCSTEIARSIGMRQHQDEVDYVLGKFFIKEGDNWVHSHIEEQIREYKTLKKSRSKAGRASAEARRRKSFEQVLKSDTTNDEQKVSFVQQTRNQKPETRNHGVESKPKKSNKFIKPNYDDLVEYFKGKIPSPGDEAHTFLNYFDSVGWVIGRTKKPMKSWKGAAATWVENCGENHGHTESGRNSKQSTVSANSRGADRMRQQILDSAEGDAVIDVDVLEKDGPDPRR